VGATWRRIGEEKNKGFKRQKSGFTWPGFTKDNADRVRGQSGTEPRNAKWGRTAFARGRECRPRLSGIKKTNQGEECRRSVNLVGVNLDKRHTKNGGA